MRVCACLRVRVLFYTILSHITFGASSQVIVNIINHVVTPPTAGELPDGPHEIQLVIECFEGTHINHPSLHHTRASGGALSANAGVGAGASGAGGGGGSGGGSGGG